MRLLNLLQREPAAVGTLITSVMPCLVLLGAVQLDEKEIAALVVAVNAIVAFGVRLVVSPSGPGVPGPAAAEPQQQSAG
jgi:drug/metabolite transporter (DMT)-like permease